jgi:phosphohistidine phosphatase
MPLLILMRHAHAEPTRPGQGDHDRQLTAHGKTEAAEIGRGLADRGIRPDLVLCSTSRRTRETLDQLPPELTAGAEVRYLRRLFDSPDYAALLEQEGGDAECVLVVGHNPFIHSTAVTLAGGETPPFARQFAPAGAAVLGWDGEWSRIRPGSMKVLAYLEPQDRG